MLEKIIIYTDGSALDNGNENSRCGWACKLIYKGAAIMKSGHDIGKTNNQMEMIAVLQAMKSVKDKTIPVVVYSDSKYVVETMNGKYNIKKNIDLWKRLITERKQFSDITFEWVKGHAKDEHNNDVDRMATGEAVRAFEGMKCADIAD